MRYVSEETENGKHDFFHNYHLFLNDRPTYCKDLIYFYIIPSAIKCIIVIIIFWDRFTFSNAGED